MKYLFGIDVGGTTVKIGFVSYEGKILDHYEIKTNTLNNGESILSDIRDSIYDYMSSHNISKNDVLGIGFGVPGPVANNVVFKCVNLGWDIKDVKKEFESLLDWNPIITCANDANVAALGEMFACNDEKIRNAVMFTLGTGVGGGIIMNRKIVDGVHGAAGELGHLNLDLVHNYKCNCGLSGCLETVASATGVVRLAKEYLDDSSVLSRIETISAKAVFDAAKNNDSIALKVVDEVGYYIGRAAAIVASVVDPDVFIIGGGVSKAGNILLDAINKHYQKYAFHAVKNIPFVLASLGNNGGMLGAALSAKQAK